MKASASIDNLSPSAQRYLASVEDQLGRLSAPARRKVNETARQSERPLSGADLMLALCTAVPSKAAEFTMIRDGGNVDQVGRAPCFRPKVNSAKIVKYGEVRPPKPPNVRNPPPPPPPRWTRDPIFFDLTMPENCPAVVVLNGRTQKRMKTVARRGVDLGAMGIAAKYDGDKELDVKRVSATADHVKGKESHEGTFDFGDPLIFVFLKPDGSERERVEFYPENESRVDVWEWRDNPNYPGYQHYYTEHKVGTEVTRGDALDDTPVPIDMGQVDVRFAAKKSNLEDRWFDAEIDTRDLTLGVEVGRGLIRELGAQAEVTFGDEDYFAQSGAKVSVGCDQTDQRGNKKADFKVRLSRKKDAARTMTWDQLLDQKVTVRASSKKVTADPEDQKNDTDAKRVSLAKLLYAPASNFTVAGERAAPRTTHRFNREVPKTLPQHRIIAFKKAAEDPECDGQRLHLRLAKGFITADDKAATVNGFQVVVGYTNKAGEWVPCATRAVTTSRESQEMSFDFDIDDEKAARDEKRVYTINVFMPHGRTPVPLQNLEIPLNKLGWG